MYSDDIYEKDTQRQLLNSLTQYLTNFCKYRVIQCHEKLPYLVLPDNVETSIALANKTTQHLIKKYCTFKNSSGVGLKSFYDSCRHRAAIHRDNWLLITVT